METPQLRAGRLKEVHQEQRQICPPPQHQKSEHHTHAEEAHQDKPGDTASLRQPSRPIATAEHRRQSAAQDTVGATIHQLHEKQCKFVEES